MKTNYLLIGLAAICVAFSPAAKAQSQLEYTPVPVVVANVHDGDFTDTETQPHILVAINMDDTTTDSGSPLSPLHQPPTEPPLFFAHNVVFPSGDSVLVDRGTVVQIAVTGTTELMLQPAPDDVGIIFLPPNP